MSPRGWALTCVVVLGVALVALIALTTPWDTLPQPVPGGSVVPHVAGDFTPQQIQRADTFRHAVRPMGLLSLGVSLAVALVLGFTPAGARLVRAVAGPLGGSWWASVIVGGLVVLLVPRLLALPFDARAEAVSRSYGLSTRSWGGWALDVAKGWALSAVLTVVALGILLALIRHFPRFWWAPAAVGAAVLVLVVSFAYPIVVEPVFNSFTPMKPGPLRTALLDLAARDGVPATDVLVADASRRTTALNAYVSGYGSTRRIVVYDTLLDKATPEEVTLVVAHELGHAKAGDVLHGTVIGAVGAAAAVCLLGVVLPWDPLRRGSGVRELADPASIALLVALVVVVSTLSGPLQALVSRRIEARADAHSLNLTRDPQTFAEMQQRLAVTNLSDLDPPTIIFGLFASHPTTPQRIALARDWARISHVPVPGPLAPAS